MEGRWEEWGFSREVGKARDEIWHANDPKRIKVYDRIFAETVAGCLYMYNIRNGYRPPPHRNIIYINIDYQLTIRYHFDAHSKIITFYTGIIIIKFKRIARFLTTAILNIGLWRAETVLHLILNNFYNDAVQLRLYEANLILKS